MDAPISYYLGLIALTWALHGMINHELKDRIENLSYSSNWGLRKLAMILTCVKCFAFWATLIYTLNPFKAAIVAAGACVLSIFINKHDTKL